MRGFDVWVLGSGFRMYLFLACCFKRVSNEDFGVALRVGLTHIICVGFNVWIVTGCLARVSLILCAFEGRGHAGFV